MKSEHFAVTVIAVAAPVSASIALLTLMLTQAGVGDRGLLLSSMGGGEVAPALPRVIGHACQLEQCTATCAGMGREVVGIRETGAWATPCNVSSYHCVCGAAGIAAPFWQECAP